MVNDNLPKFKNIKLTEIQDEISIQIRKRYEPGMLIFSVLALSFVAAMLFWLIPLAEENNPDLESNTPAMIKLIVGVIGCIMLIGIIYELLKREAIKISRHELIHEYSILGRHFSVKNYPFEKIKDLKPVDPPIGGWRLERSYEDATRTEKIYTYDTRTISFTYEGKKVLIANGISPEEVNFILNLIKKQ